MRLVKQLVRDPGTRFAAAVAGWERPVSIEVFVMGSLYSMVAGKAHPLLPDLEAKRASDIEERLADRALENMNRR